MIDKSGLNYLYEKVVRAIDINDNLFERAKREYENLGHWIGKEIKEYDSHIYVQGSFALGTVIRPLSDEDEYDIDLVCELDDSCDLSAKQLKCDLIKPLLEQYKTRSKELEEKRRCWRVDYNDLNNFHMDVVPAITQKDYIHITDKNEPLNEYRYIGSNPQEYVRWFNSKKCVARKRIQEQYIREHRDSIKSSADIEKINENRLKTPLQKAIQILKRHRDIVFAEDENNCKPLSIIITTIAAELYNQEDNIADTLINFLSNAKDYIDDHKDDDGYHIDNPVYTGYKKENFAEKWNKHPERAEAFIQWIDDAKHDLIDEMLNAHSTA